MLLCAPSWYNNEGGPSAALVCLLSKVGNPPVDITRPSSPILTTISSIVNKLKHSQQEKTKDSNHNFIPLLETTEVKKKKLLSHLLLLYSSRLSPLIMSPPPFPRPTEEELKFLAAHINPVWSKEMRDSITQSMRSIMKYWDPRVGMSRHNERYACLIETFPCNLELDMASIGSAADLIAVLLLQDKDLLTLPPTIQEAALEQQRRSDTSHVAAEMVNWINGLTMKDPRGSTDSSIRRWARSSSQPSAQTQTQAQIQIQRGNVVSDLFAQAKDECAGNLEEIWNIHMEAEEKCTEESLRKVIMNSMSDLLGRLQNDIVSLTTGKSTKMPGFREDFNQIFPTRSAS